MNRYGVAMRAAIQTPVTDVDLAHAMVSLSFRETDLHLLYDEVEARIEITGFADGSHADTVFDAITQLLEESFKLTGFWEGMVTQVMSS